MQGYPNKVKQAQLSFEAFSVRQIKRGQNSHADSLAMLATSLGLGLPQVIIVKDMMVSGHNDQTSNRVHNIQVELSWISFLRDATLPEDKIEADKI